MNRGRIRDNGQSLCWDMIFPLFEMLFRAVLGVIDVKISSSIREWINRNYPSRCKILLTKWLYRQHRMRYQARDSRTGYL